MTSLIDPGLLIALMLLSAIIGGYTAVLARVPRVVGYLASGLLLHYLIQIGALVAEPDGDSHGLLAAAGQLQGLKTLALGLIMFSMGSVFEVKHIKAVGLKIVRLGFFKQACVLLLVGGGCTLVAFVTQSYTTANTLAFGLLLGVVALATAPAATLMVLREYEAKGANSDAILSLTAVNNIVCIVLFHALFMVLSSSGVIESAYGTGRWLWWDLCLTSLGSVLLGTVLGFFFSILYAKLTVADFMLIFLGATLALGGFDEFMAESWHLSFNFLVTCLFFGATFANITPDQAAFHNALRTIAGPIFALFFVLAGFELHLDDLIGIGWVGVAYVALRVLGKTLGGWIGTHLTCIPGEIYPYIGFGMLCQAGVAIGMADFLSTTWGTVGQSGFQPAPAAQALKTIVLGSVVVFELIGPIALKRTAMSAGEVKAVTLLRRRRTPGNQSGSVFGRTWEALLQMLWLGSPKRTRPIEVLQVRHIMRSNIKILPAAARFDAVLHFAERSRLNHFPVTAEDGEYIGMIHFSDLRHIMYDPTMRDLVTAHDLSRADTPLATPELSLKQLFDLFHTTDAASLAVVDSQEHRNVVGIVEERDLLLVLRRRQADEEA